MACPVAAFHDKVIDIGLDVPANLWLEYFLGHSSESWTCVFQTSGIHTKQKVLKGVMKLVFSHPLSPSNTDGSRKNNTGET
jgi:hypothetical protein